jgi:hypothetical protein
MHFLGHMSERRNLTDSVKVLQWCDSPCLCNRRHRRSPLSLQHSDANYVASQYFRCRYGKLFLDNALQKFLPPFCESRDLPGSWPQALTRYCSRLGPRLLLDPDTYSHIALGRWILDHNSGPTTDPCSPNLRGTHWVAFEWLSQIAFAGAHAVGGWLGVVALTAAAVATTLGLMTRFLLREWLPKRSRALRSY